MHAQVSTSGPRQGGWTPRKDAAGREVTTPGAEGRSVTPTRTRCRTSGSEGREAPGGGGGGLPCSQRGYCRDATRLTRVRADVSGAARPSQGRVCTCAGRSLGKRRAGAARPVLSAHRGAKAAAAAAKSLQSCLTLCDPIDGSPPGSPVPGTLQARTLEWGAIFVSSA